MLDALEIGYAIKDRRTELGLAQKQLAEAAGVSSRCLWTLELGRNPGVRLDKLTAVLGALGLDLSISSGGKPARTPTGTPKAEAVDDSSKERGGGWMDALAILAESALAHGASPGPVRTPAQIRCPWIRAASQWSSRDVLPQRFGGSVTSDRNPCAPGSGVPPRRRTGRVELVEDARRRLSSVSDGYASRPVVYYGPHGAGKTALLNAIEGMCDDLGVPCGRIEAKKGGGLKAGLAASARAFASGMGSGDSAKAARSDAQKAAASDPFGGSALSGDIAGSGSPDDLTQLLVGLGKCAERHGRTACFCVDEMQCARKDELEDLASALHRVGQLGLPVIFFCAGLPRILKDAGDAKPYSERLFEFVRIDASRTTDS